MRVHLTDEEAAQLRAGHSTAKEVTTAILRQHEKNGTLDVFCVLIGCDVADARQWLKQEARNEQEPPTMAA